MINFIHPDASAPQGAHDFGKPLSPALGQDDPSHSAFEAAAATVRSGDRSPRARARAAKTKRRSWSAFAVGCLALISGARSLLASDVSAFGRRALRAEGGVQLAPAPGFASAPTVTVHLAPGGAPAPYARLAAPLAADAAAFIREIEADSFPEVDHLAEAAKPISGNDFRSHAVQVGIFADSNGNTNLDSLYRDDVLALDSAADESRANPQITFNARQIDAGSDGSPRTYLDRIIENGTTITQTAPGRHVGSTVFLKTAFVQHVADTLSKARSHNAAAWLMLSGHSNPNTILFEPIAASLTPEEIGTAITQGLDIHALRHADDTARGIEGVIISGCGADTLRMQQALRGAHVKTLVATATYATDFPVATLSLLTKPASRQEFVDAIVSTHANGAIRSNDQMNVDDLTSVAAKIEDQASRTVATEINRAIALDPRQNATIVDAVRTVAGNWASTSAQTQLDTANGELVYKPAIEVYHALANAPAVAPEVREAASFAERAFKNSLAASAYNANNPDQVVHLNRQRGAGIPFPVTADEVQILSLAATFSNPELAYAIAFPEPSSGLGRHVVNGSPMP